MADDVKVIVKAILDDKQFKKGVAGMGTAAKKSSAGISAGFGKIKASAIAILAAIGAAVAVLGKVIKVAKDFEKAIADVASVSSVAREELSLLARDAAVKTKFRATEAANALKTLALAGLEAKDMARVLIPALNLATAANISIEEAVQTTIGTMKTFSIDTSRAGEVVDILTKTTTSTSTNMTELAFALKFAGSAAALIGADLKDVNAILGTLADRNIKGSLAGTQLRAAFSALLKPTSDAQAVLAKYGVSMKEVQELLPTPIKLFKRLSDVNLSGGDALTIFGRRQTGVLAILKDGIPALIKNREKIEEYAGAADKAAKIQLNTLTGQIALLKSAWEELVLILTGKGGVIGGLKGVVTQVKNTVLAVGGFLKSEEGIKKVAVAVAVVKSVFLGLWTLIKVINTPMIAFIEGLAVAFLELGKVIAAVKKGEIDGIKDAFKAFSDGGIKVIKKVADRFAQAGKDVKDAGIGIGKAWTDAADQINNASKTVAKTTKKTIAPVKKEIKEIKEELVELATITPEVQKLITDSVKLNEEERLQAKINALMAFTEANELAGEDQKKIIAAITAFEAQQAKIRKATILKHVKTALAGSKQIFADAASVAGSIKQIEIDKYNAIDEADTAARDAQRQRIMKAARAEKALSIVQTVIETAVSAQRAFSAMAKIPFIGPALGAVAATAATAAGIARVAMIKRQPLPQLAKGGRLGGGQSAIVGEAGSELFTPDTPGTVFSNRVVRGLTFGQTGVSGVQGGTTINEDNSSSSKNFIFNGIRDISEARNELIQLEGEDAF